MNPLSLIFGAAGNSLAETVGKVADNLFTSDEERLDKQALLARIQNMPYLAQLRVNMQEAQHRSLWVAGWRPAVGWICASAIGYHFILHPLISWGMTIAVAFGAPVLEPPPSIDTGPLFALVTAMLGFAGLRSGEKSRGITR